MAINERADTLKLRISDKQGELDGYIRDKNDPRHLDHTINSLEREAARIESLLIDARHRKESLDLLIDTASASLRSLQLEYRIEQNSDQIVKFQAIQEKMNTLLNSIPPDILAAIQAKKAAGGK